MCFPPLKKVKVIGVLNLRKSEVLEGERIVGRDGHDDDGLVCSDVCVLFNCCEA